jgi:hypothetical protein
MGESSSVRRWIELAAAGDPSAIAQLWNLVTGTARPTIFHRLHQSRIVREPYEAIWHDFFVYLFDSSAKRLSQFRGNNEAEFVSFVRTIARNYAGTYCRRWRVSRSKEPAPLGDFQPPDYRAGSEAEIVALFGELEEIASWADRKRFRLLRAQLGDDTGDICACKSRSPRGIRRLAQQLCRHYADRAIYGVERKPEAS